MSKRFDVVIIAGPVRDGKPLPPGTYGVTVGADLDEFIAKRLVNALSSHADDELKAIAEEDANPIQTLLDSIEVGDRVTIRVPAGIGRNGLEWTERTGRAVIISPGHVALNMGGRHGTPGVATVKNIVSVRKGR